MPTRKQKEAAKKIVENRGNVSKGMVEAGYSPNTAKNPKNLTNSKGWKELMDELLPESLVAETHKQLLGATGVGHMVFPVDVTDEQIIKLMAEAGCYVKRFMHSDTQTHCWYFAPDNNARKSAIDMAYKLRGNYAPEKHEIKNTTLSDLLDKAEALEKQNGKKKR